MRQIPYMVVTTLKDSDACSLLGGKCYCNEEKRDWGRPFASCHLFCTSMCMVVAGGVITSGSVNLSSRLYSSMIQTFGPPTHRLGH